MQRRDYGLGWKYRHLTMRIDRCATEVKRELASVPLTDEFSSGVSFRRSYP